MPVAGWNSDPLLFNTLTATMYLKTIETKACCHENANKTSNNGTAYYEHLI